MKLPETLIVGVDLGQQGGWCVLDPYGRKILQVFDMPLAIKVVAGAKRRGIDVGGVLVLVRTILDFGVKLLVVEEAGRRPGQSSGAAVTIGYGAGVIHTACTSEGLRYEEVSAARWKRALRVPADKWGSIQRADQLFPDEYLTFRGVRGGKMDGRAEAAMIALWGAENILEIRR